MKQRLAQLNVYGQALDIIEALEGQVASLNEKLTKRDEAVGRQWFDFLVSKGFVERDTELDCWLYLMGFSSTQPCEVKPVEWLKTVETARLMLCRVHGNLLASKELTVVRMKELASQCFTKQGEPLKLAKPRKESSLDADEIENFVPTISDL